MSLPAPLDLLLALGLLVLGPAPLALGPQEAPTAERRQDAPPPAEKRAGPSVHLTADHFDFGTVKAGTTVNGVLEIQNQGDALLSVTRIGVTCECAKLQLSTPRRPNVPIDHADQGKTDLAIGPGESATLKLTVDTAKLAPGLFEKRCLILCSDPTKSPLSVPFRLTIEARKTQEAAAPKKPVEVLDEEEAERRPGPDIPPTSGPPPCIEADQYKAEFGEVYRGEKLFHTFKLKNTGEGDLVFYEVRSTCACAVAKFTIGDKSWSSDELATTKRIGSLKKGEEATLELELKTTKSMIPGKDVLISKALRVYTNDAQRNPLVLTLEARMTSPFEIEPASIEFGRVKKGAGATMSALIYSDQLKPFVVAGARPGDDQLLSVTATKITGDDDPRPPTWRIDATVAKSAPLGNYATHVDLQVDHPRVKEIVVPVTLWVEPNVSFTGNRADGADFLDFDIMDGQSDKTLELKIENGDPSLPYVPTSLKVEAKPSGDAFKAELVEIEKGMKYVVKLTAPKTLAKSTFFTGSIVLTSDHPDLAFKKVAFRGWFKLPKK
jgi:hypothetical protein